MTTGTVTLETVVAQPLAAVLERVPLGGIGPRVRVNLDKVYAFLKTHPDIRKPGAHNVFVYRYPASDGRLAVEFGVQAERDFEREDDVFATTTPAGRCAMAVHTGPYEGLRETHDAVQRWCHDNGHTRAGIDWEIYGDWNDDPAKLQTTVCYLLT